MRPPKVESTRDGYLILNESEHQLLYFYYYNKVCALLLYSKDCFKSITMYQGGGHSKDDFDRSVALAAEAPEGRQEVPPHHSLLALIKSLVQLQAAAARGRRGLDGCSDGSQSYGTRFIMVVKALHQRLHGNPNTVRTLLARAAAAAAATSASGSVNVTATKEYLLHIASCRGLRVVVRALLQGGAKVNATVRPYRYYALKGVLLEGMAALHWAASRGHSGIVKDLLASGANKNAKVTHSGETALHLAARCGHHATVCVLLGAGVDPVTLSRSNLSPLDLAACNNHAITVRAFLYHGIDPNRANPLGYTALHQAAYHNAVDALEILIKAGGDVAAVARRGFTPLHVAAFSSSTTTAAADRDTESSRCQENDASRRRSAVLTLARHGGEVNALDASGSTPLRLARIYRREQSVADLLSVGGKMDSVGSFVSPNTAAHPDSSTTSDKNDPTAARMADEIVGNTADKAWKRRGWLTLFRTRVLESNNNSTSHNPSTSTGKSGRRRYIGGLVDDRRVKRKTSETGEGDLSDGFWEVVKRTVTVEGDDIFKRIVCFV